MKNYLFTFLILISIHNVLLSQNILFVKSDATGSNNGTSWTDAYTDLQSALSNATAGDTIWVAAGTYTPSVPGGNWATFQMVKRVGMYGGFNGTETSLSQRDYTSNQTILSGDIGVIGDITDNVNHVVSGIDSARLDGFIIQDGYAHDLNNGGGMYNYIADNTIENLSIVNCTFTNNYALSSGNAIYNGYTENLSIINCTFEDNNVGWDAMGGAIFNTQSSNVVIDKCYFHNNYASSGGAIYNEITSMVVSNSIIIGNQTKSGGKGGGIFTNAYCKIINTVIAKNYSKDAAGCGVYTTVGDSIINCTFDNNLSNKPGANFADENTASAIVNSILVSGNANPSTDGFDYWNYSGATHKITYSCYTGYEDLSGTGNITGWASNIFVDEAANDFHLAPGISCIDAGNGNVAPSTDIENNIRHDDFSVENSGTGNPNYVDMGAYEFQGNSPMHGIYTIGTSGDFHTFSQSVDSLISLGIDGAVTFNVQPGTYNEQVTLPGVLGESSTNTITFQSATGDSTDVVLTYASTDQNNNYTLKLDSADYVTFKSMTFQATGTSYARIIHLSKGSSYVVFSHNRFVGKPNLSELVFANIAVNGDPSSRDLSFINNRFENGQKGISLSGYYISNTVIEGNEFEEVSQYAVFIFYSQHALIQHNRITSHWDNAIGIQIQKRTESDTLNANVIKLYSDGIGIHLYNTQQVTDTSVLTNNFVYINSTLADHAIDIYGTKAPVKIFHNTVHVTGSNINSYCLYVNGNGTNTYKSVLNNILSNEATGKAFYFYYSPHQSDYNILWSNGQYILRCYNSNLDLEYWRKNFHHDLHSSEVDPYFVSDDSWQVANMEANGNAVPGTGVTTDIEDNSRNAVTPDIGSWEFTPAPVPLHGTYTIGGTTADFDSLKDAVKALEINGVDGAVVFNIRSGTYKEQLVLHKIQGASESNAITFRSASGDSTDVIITYTPVYDTKPYTVLLDGVDHIVWNKLSIQTGDAAGIPLWLKNGACFNEVSQALLTAPTDNNQPLIQIGSDDLAYSNTDSNNVFRDSRFLNGRYAVLAGKPGSSNSPVVSGNTAIENNRIENALIYMTNDANPVISGNRIHIQVNSSYTDAISIESNALVYNNFILVDNPSNLSYARGIYCFGGNNGIYYNSIKITGEGIPVKAKGHTEVLNNIMITTDKTAFLNTDTTGCNIDYNIYFTSSASQVVNNGTLESWQDNNGFDLHSLFYNPVFASDTDFHTTDPWLNNRGIPVAEVTTDIDGDPRDATNPDIGADEFDGVSPLKGTYTIGTAGDFKSFSEAADTLRYCGVEDSVIFRVLEGTYEEQFTLDDRNITRLPDTAAIVFQAENSDSGAVTLQYAVSAWDNCIVTLNRATYVTFEGITFKSLNDTVSYLLNISDTSMNNKFLDNTFIGTDSRDPLLFSLTDNDNNNVIRGNRFYYGGYGVYLAGKSITNPEIGWIIKDNLFMDQKVSGIYLTNERSPVITANRIYHTAMIDENWAGIFLANGDEGLVVNNVISFRADRKSAGIALSKYSNSGIFYNSVWIYGSTTDSRAFNQENVSNNNTLKNNILNNTSGGLAIYSADASAFTSDHNGFQITGDRFAWTDHMMNTFDDWVSETGQDGHSHQADPAFFSVDSLYTVSPLLNGTAEPISRVSTDITGAPRDAAKPDMGAYEFTGRYTLPFHDTVICRHTSILLDAGAGFDAYLWNTGETTQTIRTDSLTQDKTKYKVTVTLTGESYSDSLNVSFKGPEIDLGGDRSICQGSSLTLNAGSGYQEYLWNDNSTGSTLDVTEEGTYSVKVTDAEGCFDYDTATITVNLPAAVSLSYDNGQLQADYQNGSLYTWYLDGNTLSSGQEYTITPTNSGDYHVQVIDENGCTAVSDTLHVSLTGIYDPETNGISIYPNPSGGMITLTFPNTVEDIQISVFDLIGNKVYESAPEKTEAMQKNLDLQNLPSGIYLLHIQTDEKTSVLRMVIHH